MPAGVDSTRKDEGRIERDYQVHLAVILTIIRVGIDRYLRVTKLSTYSCAEFDHRSLDHSTFQACPYTKWWTNLIFMFRRN